ncbi:BTB/POZ protein [Thamnocephalis sphaerospora]|uniref:Elongin-C n=1 Tax=Thamnocephalis sphaerospora TaxID=78915 RepID=A0A4V1IWQ6_9FUNG|nr:BTB/POZ protein [Thamnocephalis sphaerospora]|eukprot:RKP08389.1 BTB/POZ protein [Thamnocephalis sphaerospora]
MSTGDHTVSTGAGGSSDATSSTTGQEDMVRLISSDGKVFSVRREVAFGSGTIRNMLSGEGYFSEALSNEVNFPEIRGEILQKVCDYLEYKHEHKQHTRDIPEFPVDVEHALELLMAADYLDGNDRLALRTFS